MDEWMDGRMHGAVRARLRVLPHGGREAGGYMEGGKLEGCTGVISSRTTCVIAVAVHHVANRVNPRQSLRSDERCGSAKETQALLVAPALFSKEPALSSCHIALRWSRPSVVEEEVYTKSQLVVHWA